MSPVVIEAALPWRERLFAWRDRAVASPRFRRWATTFPLTRPIARRRTRALFDLCAGFVYSQILLACVQLDVFEILAERPASIASLAIRLRLSVEATERLLAAATALQLTSRRGDRYALGPLGAAMVGNAAIQQMVLHHPMLYADLQDPVALLQGQKGGTELASYWSYASAGEGPVAAYTALMAASQPLVSDEVIDAYSLGQHRHLMDVGGGDGSFLVAVAERVPGLQLTLYDLPAVAEMACSRFAVSRLTDRARAVGGSFLTESLPGGADVISLVRVIHDHNDPEALTILRAVRAALPKDGVVLLAEPMAETAGAEPVGHAYFGFYLLAMGQGRPRTAAKLMALLQEAGFAKAQLLRTRSPLLARVIIANVNPD
ncbi:methyltransferase [Acidisphaera sp. L21]|uniref:methyltransferase n=1 Tax=Acidisphaera sp. L21 TaxID=1641851 RepID=UPI00131A8B40|nr:methyltransferase [Acidisphaera sp. L21]